MRRWLAVPSLVVALMLLGSPALLAQSTMQPGEPVFGGVSSSRFISVRDSAASSRAFAFDRRSQRFIDAPHHRFVRGRFTPFDQFAGFDGLIGEDDGFLGAADGLAEGDGNLAAPGAVFGVQPPSPPRPLAELPPCHETTPVGVVIERGGGCTNAALR